MRVCQQCTTRAEASQRGVCCHNYNYNALCNYVSRARINTVIYELIPEGQVTTSSRTMYREGEDRESNITYNTRCMAWGRGGRSPSNTAQGPRTRAPARKIASNHTRCSRGSRLRH
ncbi:hypothetical protein J6590_024948 [Homalodisca vitripennis]|nr:hypothetical protein J6590_024948 [Homalodisca vitripennis]